MDHRPRTPLRRGACDTRKLAAGVTCMAVGATVLVSAASYDLGTASNMGPGYFPAVLGAAMIVLGLVSTWQGAFATEATEIGPWPVRQTAAVIAGTLMFAGSIETLGLIPAVLAATLIFSVFQLRTHPLQVAVTCMVLVGVTVGLFKYLIPLPVDLWGF